MTVDCVTSMYKSSVGRLVVLTDTGLRGVGVDDARQQPVVGSLALGRVTAVWSACIAAQAVITTCCNRPTTHRLPTHFSYTLTDNIICIDATIVPLSPVSGMLLPLVIYFHMF